MSHFCWIPITLRTFFSTDNIKAGPLSESRTLGTPRQVKTSFTNICAVCSAVWIRVGKVSTQQRKASSITNKKRCPRGVQVGTDIIDLNTSPRVPLCPAIVMDPDYGGPVACVGHTADILLNAVQGRIFGGPPPQLAKGVAGLREDGVAPYF